MLTPVETHFNTVVFALGLTIAAYALGIKLYRISGQSSLLQPVVTGILIVSAAILFLDIDLRTYLQNVEILNTLLGTATVALAYPLHKNKTLIKENIKLVLFGVILCGALTTAIAVLIAWVLGASSPVLLSLAPKAISTPFAIGVAELIGGYPPLAAGVVIVTGIIIAIIATPTFKVMNISNPKIRGLAMGINGHGIATARAFEIDSTTGAFSALGMGLMGIYISTILPIIALIF